MHNERFERYYKAQSILPDDEWDRFMEAMRTPLPTTFRVTGSRQAARLLNDTIKDIHVPHLTNIIFEGEAVPPPAQIPWYPEGLAWQLNVAKKVVRKSPEFKKFHSFLVYETEVGNISRQEAVSMLPPLFLEVEPHHRVIDMCAAPGSKTAQLLEAMHAHDSMTASSYPSGLLIANDSDYKRTHMLIHQAARLPSPALIVTNHDASIYPAIKIPSEQSVFPSNTKPRVAAKKQYQLLFDRILCDVPCSGDGTLRKNVAIWKHWQPMDGNGLHSLQIRILQRGMRMLKKGGRIVYSTCSLNPVENEAVVAAALQSIPGFELVDMSNHLPCLVHRHGMISWVPTVDRNITTDFLTYEDYWNSLSEEKRQQSKMLESHWPPMPEEAQSLNLTRCIRIYPHLQDTGGFFIAVLQKVPPPPDNRRNPDRRSRQAEAVGDPYASTVKKPKLADDQPSTPEGASTDIELPEGIEDELLDGPEDEDEGNLPTEVSESQRRPAISPEEFKQQQKGKKHRGDGGGVVHFKENPFTFVSPGDPIIQTCMRKLHLQSSFPAQNILVRNPEGDPVRSLYMTNDIVKHIVQHNDYVRMRLMTAGTKVFAKQEGVEAKREGVEPQFRTLAEGLPVVLPYIEPGAILEADVVTLKILMEAYYPLCTGFTEPFKSLIESQVTGSYVVRFRPGQIKNATLFCELVLPIWKSNVSVTLMIDKKAKSALSLRLFGEDITVATKDAARKKQESTLTDGAAILKEGATIEDRIPPEKTGSTSE
ncbi:S-adenosyl-L-methionine-dependent methyltransferase [Daedalea quercina L-15889]|uniref:S-adenosyl-L-methionine-dependent methyltransferase n=1 Tax=Daedalea quercina L-15889 TaxID=1314783 RepID=A0A165SI05_9APHY|nr:S-adenosyl-L-methionine-dependent methyltransferase [Daedalea quercina L-15889]